MLEICRLKIVLNPWFHAQLEKSADYITIGNDSLIWDFQTQKPLKIELFKNIETKIEPKSTRETIWTELLKRFSNI